jgi:hypothetical protein
MRPTYARPAAVDATISQCADAVACALAGCSNRPDPSVPDQIRDAFSAIQWAVLMHCGISENAKLEIVELISNVGFSLADAIQGVTR